MFDPDVVLSPRLAKDLGLKDTSFYAKNDNDEQELKYRVTGGYSVYDGIRGAIADKPNRMVDENSWTSNQYALVTLNLDTKNQDLAHNGYSLRVRFALTKGYGGFIIDNIDMCIKTLMPSEKTTILHEQTRGEWEAHLQTLEPSMAAMIAHNRGKKPALPAFFQDGHIRDEDLFVESTGCTLRNVFNSFEIVQKRNKVLVPVFQHTEDVANVFLTPHGDAITAQDSEAEAEFLGVYGMSKEETSEEKFDKTMRKSMKLLDSIIMTADPGKITRNLISKATRARNGLESLYGPDDKKCLSSQFGMQARIENASHFALMQEVRPADTNVNIMWHHIERMRAQVARERAMTAEIPFRHDRI